MRNPIVAGVICSVLTIAIVWALEAYVISPWLAQSDDAWSILGKGAVGLAVLFTVGWLVDRRAASRSR